jgi:hypothetical protein
MAATVPASRTRTPVKEMVPDAPPTLPDPAANPGTPATPCPALHLLDGRWVASCPSCGYQLATARTQARAERRAARRSCPVCHQEGR